MTTPITPDEARLRELAEAATPGPWRNGADPSHFDSPEVTDDRTFSYYVRTDKDAAFIASANPATILSLLDALSAERERVADMQRRLDLWELKPTSGSSISVSSRIGGNNAPLATQKAEGA